VNPLIDDRDVTFLLYDVHDAAGLCALPHFAEHSRETFDLYLASCRKLAREVLYPAYAPMDHEPPSLVDGRVAVHPQLAAIYPRMVELGIINATRPFEVGGAQLPVTVFGMANVYLMAANLAAYAYLGLTTGAARLIESFGSDDLKEAFMVKMYAGEWTGTMALTEPDAGSSLSDVTTTATPVEGASHHLIAGTKVFISGGEHDLTDNIVHLTLARIAGAPAGTKGVSLFAIPKLRPEGESLVDNDCLCSGVFHKIGWKGLPSISLTFGERGACHGYLVGEPNQGLRHMFQMMNEARLMVGLNAVATASVAYQEALDYARERPQGRSLSDRDPTKPQIPIIEHTDVRRMLLRQKAIIEGSLSLLIAASRYEDLRNGSTDDAERARASELLDLLTPIAKTIPAELGFEANTLAIQIHGGYGYTSEYMPESWWRDQKLNSIHEGTTGIQSLDLLGRKVMRNGGEALRQWGEEVGATIARARDADVDPSWCQSLEESLGLVASLTAHLGALGMGGDGDGMLRHSVDYLELMGIIALGWQWLEMATAAKRGLAKGDRASSFYEGKLCAAQYWFRTEVTRVPQLVALCRDGDDSYARMAPDWF
jgi:alkylation response protein AidB-like acyl-CoA dehydrogenase